MLSDSDALLEIQVGVNQNMSSTGRGTVNKHEKDYLENGKRFNES